MAHRPEDKFVGAWFSPAQIKQVNLLASALGYSRSELLRQLVDIASGRIKPEQKTEAMNLEMVAANGRREPIE